MYISSKTLNTNETFHEVKCRLPPAQVQTTRIINSTKVAPINKKAALKLTNLSKIGSDIDLYENKLYVQNVASLF